jgi:hypothetical protein
VKNIDVSTDPADYLTGPTGNQTSRTSGGTNTSGGISVVDVDEDVAVTRTADPQPAGESTPAPAPANQTGT